MACCRSTAIADMTISPSRTARAARSRWPTVWRMRDGSSSTCTSSTADPVAAEALRRIGEVYAIEARIRGLTAEQRLAVRQGETKLLMAALRSWLMERLGEISAKSSLAARSATRSAIGKG